MHRGYLKPWADVNLGSFLALDNLRSTFQVTQGGADLADLWEEFQQFVQKSSNLATGGWNAVTCEFLLRSVPSFAGKEGVAFNTVVLQVGKGSGESGFVITESCLFIKSADDVCFAEPKFFVCFASLRLSTYVHTNPHV